jgi:FkbM family methyltransferase
MMNLLRRIASLPGLRNVLLQPRIRHMVASILALRFLRVAGLTTRPVRFILNDLLLARQQIRTYVLRTGQPVMLKHRRDTEAFHELYRSGEYEPPEALASRLNGTRDIVDLGGNIGMFTHWAAQEWPEARITSFEPVPENTEVFRKWLTLSGIDAELKESCALTHNGVMHISSGSGAGTVLAEGTASAGEGLPGVDVFPHLAEADLVKMDIEGGEWPILADPRMAALHNITLVLEYHRAGAPFLPADAAARSLLEEAGFTVGHGHHNYWGHGILWAWKD